MLKLLLCLSLCLLGCTSVQNTECTVDHEEYYGKTLNIEPENAAVSVTLPCGHTVVFQLVDGVIMADQPDVDTIKSLDKKRD